jgi:hypothetical protein
MFFCRVGCWNSNGEGQTECLVGVCSGQKHSSKSTRFCCCEGSYCNLNYTNAVDPEPQPITNVNVKLPAAARPMEQQDSNLQTYLILAALVALGLLIISGFFFMRHRYHNLKPEVASSKEDDLKGLSRNRIITIVEWNFLFSFRDFSQLLVF